MDKGRRFTAYESNLLLQGKCPVCEEGHRYTPGPRSGLYMYARMPCGAEMSILNPDLTVGQMLSDHPPRHGPSPALGWWDTIMRVFGVTDGIHPS